MNSNNGLVTKLIKCNLRVEPRISFLDLVDEAIKFLFEKSRKIKKIELEIKTLT